MDQANTSFFDLAERRMSWTDRRAAVLAQNIANADTPGWRTRDLKPFAETLARSAGALTLTDPAHMVGVAASSQIAGVQPGERAPDGNSVALDKELIKVAETDTSHALVSDLYRKYMSMYRTALGK